MATALGNIRVLDFSRVLAGPFLTMILGDLGADVIKVERPDGGDETRGWGPPFDSAGRSTYFESINRNKTSIALDLTDAADCSRAAALVRTSDVLVENFRPGVMGRFGLGYEELREDKPELVYCSITGFGTDRGARLPGYDPVIQAVGGLMSITGPRDGAPHKVGVALVDVLAGLFAAVGILAALRHRDATGEGQHVEIDLLSSLLAALVNQGAAYTVAEVVPERLGNGHPSVAPFDLFSTADGDLVLAVGNDQQFASLCAVLGEPSLADDRRFATNAARVAHGADLRRIIERRLAQRPAAVWAKELVTAHVPAGVVNDIAAAFSLAEELGLDPIVSVPRDDGTVARVTRNPIRLSATPASYRLPPPDLPARAVSAERVCR